MTAAFPATRRCDTDSSLYDVAIVGFGPAGATLANLLALRGIRTLVLEREADIYRLPRAIHFDGECMRVFQTIGIAHELAGKLVVAPGMRFVDAKGRLLIDWQRPTEVGPQGWHASYRFHQPDLEAALRQRLAGSGSVDVRLRHEVFAIEQQSDCAVLRFEDMASGQLRQAAARYVVGCDGARSLVRRLMGTELEDMKSHERWLVVDVVLKREREDLGDHSIQYCDPARPATYVRGVGSRRRWELMVMPGEDPAVMTRPEAIWKLLSKWVTPDDAELERPAVYTFHSVVAQGWRRERLLIAGDAAHQTPPFLGQGMCAGIRDASNLAWKLADVVTGQACASLLDTYESERSPHVREFIETAVRLGAVIQATDSDASRQCDQAFSHKPQMLSTPQPRLGPGAHDAGAAGCIAMQPRRADGMLMDDLVGYRYTLVIEPGLLHTTQSLLRERAARERATDGPALYVAHDAQTRAWLAGLPARAALLRPDRYLAGFACDTEELAALLDRTVTRLRAAGADPSCRSGTTASNQGNHQCPDQA